MMQMSRLRCTRPVNLALKNAFDPDRLITNSSKSIGIVCEWRARAIEEIIWFNEGRCVNRWFLFPDLLFYFYHFVLDRWLVSRGVSSSLVKEIDTTVG